jgi:hypothetical protein
MINRVLIAAGHVVMPGLVLVPAAEAEERMWIAKDDVVRRTCPSVDCGVVGGFFFGEAVMVFETKNGWSRVSRRYPAACYDGKSIFVEAGPSECTEANGIRQGELAEWVESGSLAETKTPRPQRHTSR